MELYAEPYTGKTIKFTYDYDVCTYIEEPLPFPNLPSKMVPLMHVHIVGNFTNMTVFEFLTDSFSSIRLVRIILIISGSVGLILCILGLFIYFRKKKPTSRVILGDDNAEQLV